MSFASPVAIRRICVALLLVAVTYSCGDGSNHRTVKPDPELPILPPAPLLSAREAIGDSDLLAGPLARGRIGDYVLENELLRVIIQRPGRQWLGVGTYGGNIIDAGAVTEDGDFLPDHLEEFVVGINVENTPNYTEVRVESDGSDGEAAIICAAGPDDLLEYANASSAIRGLGFQFPDSADDRDLPLEIETCYTLRADQAYITMDTVLRNTSSEELALYHVEYLSGSGQVEAFQPRAGFGEPQITPSCPEESRVACSSADDGLCDQCNFLAYAGIDGAAGVSYGLIHETPGTSSFATSGISVLVLGQNLFDLLLGLSDANFIVPAEGELTLRRYFAVGDGTVASIADIRDELFGIETGELAGQVSSGGEAIAGAQVAVYRELDGRTEPPSLFMAGHTRSDEEGNYSLRVPPGEYLVRANKDGFPFPEDDPFAVAIESGVRVERAIELPSPGFLEVTVLDDLGPGPAKLQLVGFDPSPPLENRVQFFDAGVFGDVNADGLPFGIAFVSFIDRTGDSGRLVVEPGDYELVLSRGPRYSAYRQRITITPGQVTVVQGELVKLVDTPGFVHGDFHVHGIDSPDSEVTREERVASYLAEGMDFFTPSEHGSRVDFTPTLEAMGVTDLLATATNSESTTFDYGHFNSWPLTIDPDSLSGGTVDWGREAPPGMDFPEYGSYNLSPAEIIEGLAADPKGNVVQINHTASFFSAEGLGIDTGLTPPQSTVDVVTRRLDPALANGFDDGFDTLEVWIGTNGRGGIFGQFLGQNAGDWFNLLNQGIVRFGTANSDSHNRRFTGLSARNLIASEISAPGELATEAERLAASVRAGRSIGSNAPFLLLTAEGRFAGQPQVAGLATGQDTTIPLDPNTPLAVSVRVQTPGWARVDRLEFYINSRTVPREEGGSRRYGICADLVVAAGSPDWTEKDVVVNERVAGAIRQEVEVTVSLPSLPADSWIVAIARGSDGVSSPLFPVLPASLDQQGNETLEDLVDGNVGQGGVPAFAFSNPLFIDLGGDGWQAPGVSTGSCEDG